MNVNATWATLPQTSETDNAMRRAAALACGFLEDQYSFCDPANAGRTIGKVVWLRRWNRDHLARVFAAAYESRGWGNGIWPVIAFNNAWSDSIYNPRAALCSLLDLLSVPVPQELRQ